ncbi:MAG: acetylxylan esterase [Pirellulaceae bacterium]|nr:acetylxylan esterase [Pirellulaceae bacterium]
MNAHATIRSILLGGLICGWLLVCAGLSAGAETPLRTMKYTSRPQADAAAWQQEVRARLWPLLKLDDLAGKGAAIALHPALLSCERKDGYELQEIEINSTPTRRIKVLVARPAAAGTPRPAAVCIHGHGGNRRIVYEADSLYRGFAAALAQRGYVTIAADVGQHAVYEADRTLMGERLWDLMRCVDYLESLPEVDRSRIGCGGLSLGGEMAMWLGGMDTRIAATASCGFLTKMDQMEHNHCLCWKFDGLRELVDFADIYSLTGRFRRHLFADRSAGSAVPEWPARAAVAIPGSAGRRGSAGGRLDLRRLRPAAEGGPAGAPRRTHHQLAGAGGVFRRMPAALIRPCRVTDAVRR